MTGDSSLVELEPSTTYTNSAEINSLQTVVAEPGPWGQGHHGRPAVKNRSIKDGPRRVTGSQLVRKETSLENDRQK